MDEETINDIASRVAELIRREMTPVYDKPLYTVKEAAAFLGVRRSYIYELVRSNKIPYTRSKGGKLVYIRREDLVRWATAIPVPSIYEVSNRNKSV